MSEFEKYRKIKKLNKESAKKYDEFAENYQYLIKELVHNTPIKTTLRFILGFDFYKGAYETLGAQRARTITRKSDISNLYSYY